MTEVQEKPRSAIARPERRPFGPGGLLWETQGLVTFSLSTGAAFLLQTMHPTVGEVVAEHSVYRTDALGRAARSIASVMTWVYGGEEALSEADRLRSMHATLNTTDADGVAHHALASGPWAWIILTAPYALTTSSRYFSRRPYTREETEQLYAEIVQLMRNLHVAEKEIPPTYDEYLARFDEIMENTLVAHPTAYSFLETTRHIPPPIQLPTPLHPLWRVVALIPGRVQYFVTVGTLPERARAKLGLPWSSRDERRLRALGRTVARIVPLLPERLRYLPIAYEARRAERAKRRLRTALARRPL
ncbi:oxygenase MpaB family protein [Amycolatopsis sp. NPDC059027]|uniref:oxygenase MpaB family protein n=1 Tax=unclassified Amycolatopsis TaxID=2618356 RepID=UPI003671A0D9